MDERNFMLRSCSSIAMFHIIILAIVLRFPADLWCMLMRRDCGLQNFCPVLYPLLRNAHTPVPIKTIGG